MFVWEDFWNAIKVYFVLVGVALTAFLSIGAVYLAWWINDSFGIVVLIILALLALIGGGAILTDEKEEKND